MPWCWSVWNRVNVHMLCYSRRKIVAFAVLACSYLIDSKSAISAHIRWKSFPVTHDMCLCACMWNRVDAHSWGYTLHKIVALAVLDSLYIPDGSAATIAHIHQNTFAVSRDMCMCACQIKDMLISHDLTVQRSTACRVGFWSYLPDGNAAVTAHKHQNTFAVSHVCSVSICEYHEF